MPAPDPQKAIKQLHATRRDLVSLVGNVPTERLRRSPRNGEWSAAAVVAHLADAELVYGVRLRMVVAGARPFLPGYDEKVWADRFGDLDTDLKDTIARWRALRESNLRLLESLDEDEWRLTGLHAERGEESVARLAERMAAHDRDHLDQIRLAVAD